MEYKALPFYKYLIIFIMIYMFFQHARQITRDKFLVIAIIIVSMVIALDYIIIDNHPSIINVDNIDNILNDEDFDKIFDSEISDETQ